MSNWQEYHLSDITTLIKDGTHGTHKEDASGIPLLSAKDINFGKIDYTNTPRRISKIEFDAIHRNYHLQDNDILLTIVGTLGRVARVKNYADTFTLQRSVAILRFESTSANSDFMYHVLSSQQFQKELAKRESKGAQGGVYLGEIAKIKVRIPTVNEQQRIVDVLTVWDVYLEKLEQKIALKEQLKKGLMQQLLTGKTRLPGFSDAWDNTKIGEIANIAKGRALSSSGIKHGEYSVIAGGKTSPYKHNAFTHENVITISASGAYAGYVSYHKNRIWASDCSVISEKKEKSGVIYLYFLLNFLQRKLYSYQSGGAQPHIYPKDIAVIKVAVPGVVEQKHIAKIITASDDEILKLKAQKILILKQKQYLLKNLITGAIRTPDLPTTKEQHYA